MQVRPANPGDAAQWLAMRACLWPGHAGHASEVAAYFTQADPLQVVLVADDGGCLVGFAEIGTRAYADGCLTSPVAYVEGWWVEPSQRLRGIGRALLAGAEAWARDQGLKEIASDCTLQNTASGSAHVACGFQEVQRIICLRKSLLPP